MSENDENRECSIQPFDMQEWLESVEDKTVILDAPEGFPEIAEVYYLPPWARPHSEFYCSECDAMRFPVFHQRYPPQRHCPVCGNEPGILELGTTGQFKEVEPNEIRQE